MYRIEIVMIIIETGLIREEQFNEREKRFVKNMQEILNEQSKRHQVGPVYLFPFPFR